MNIFCRPSDSLDMHQAIDRLRGKVAMGIETKEESLPFSRFRYLRFDGERVTQSDVPLSHATEVTVREFCGLLDPPPFTYAITYPAGPLTVTVQSTDAKLFRAACADLASRASTIVEALMNLQDPDTAHD